jgi:hypothetical protein
VLDSWDLFREVISQSKMFDKLSISHPGNKDKAIDCIVEKCKEHVKLVDLYKEETFRAVWKFLGNDDTQTQIFTSAPTKKRLKDTYDKLCLNNTATNEIYNKDWKPLCLLFTYDSESGRKNAITINHLLNSKVFTENNNVKPIVVVDLSTDNVTDILWNDKIQSMVIKRLLDVLGYSAVKMYKEGQSLNTLVIIDEAHRLAPRERIDDEVINSVKGRLIDAVRTTRKYGLGWMFISQTLSSLDRSIIDMLRITFFGFGLALGTEHTALKELAGGDKNALKLYQSFRDPHSTFDMESRQYSFMSIGPVSPLSFSGTPLFFTAFNTPDDFLLANGLK